MKKKKVILLAHEHLYGGGTKQTFYIAQALVKAGIETILVSNAKETWLGEAIKQSGLPIKTHYSSSIRRAIRPLQELRVFCFLIQVYWLEKPDAVMASGVKLIGLSGIAGWLCRVPLRFAIIRGEGSAPGTLMLKIIYGMERLLALFGTRYITVSEYIRQQMLKQNVCKENQVKTIHDGIHLSDFPCRIESSAKPSGMFTLKYNLPLNAFKIGMVGRLVNGKRYDQFIDLIAALCKEFPHVYGVIIGEGEQRSLLEEQIQATGFAKRIIIAGYYPNMAEVYQDLDMTVLLSDYEGCPNSILESMAAKVPVLASDVCGVGEIIHSGKNGYLIAPGDTAGAIKFIRQIVEEDQAGKQLADAGYQTVFKHFNIEHQVQQVLDTLCPQSD
jgi:glycosyltransferase involved in cell wall biosynthesis